MIERARSRGRVDAWRGWTAGAGRAASSNPLADLALRASQRIRDWTIVEVAPGRLVPWLAVAFGTGIIIYFSVDREPALWASTALFATAIACAVLLRHRPFAFAAALGCAAIAAGLAGATIKRALIEHPVLSTPAWNVDIGGFVEMREERERSDRITLRAAHVSGPRLPEQLERVRVAVRKGTAPP